MDVSRPHAVIIPTLEADVLLVLAGSSRRMTGREIARLVRRGCPDGVRKALHRLADQGVVEVEEARPALLYHLNRDHLATPIVDALAGLRAELLRRLRHEIARWETPPAHVSLFGSAARGEGDIGSDIDLLVARRDDVKEDDPGWQEQINRLARNVQRWTGNRAGIVEMAESDRGWLLDEQPAILSSLRTDAITLAGPGVTTLIGEEP